MSRPGKNDHPEYFTQYIDLVTEEDLPAAFAAQLPVIRELLSSISEQQSMFAYAPGKWSIKEMLQHLIDAERIFSYRALSIARKESASLPGFDENAYASNSEANQRNWLSLCNEFMNVRRSTLDLFENFRPEMLEQRGISNTKEMTVLSLGYIALGHTYHHFKVIKEKYLQPAATHS